MEDTNKNSFAGDLIAFVRTRKKVFLLPLILLLLSLGVILVIVEGSALSPFLYALF